MTGKTDKQTNKQKIQQQPKAITDNEPVTSRARIQVDSACLMIAIQIHTFVLCSQPAAHHGKRQTEWKRSSRSTSQSLQPNTAANKLGVNRL